MLKGNLEGKLIAIVGFNSLTAKVLIRRLVGLTREKIVAVVVGKNQGRKERFVGDGCFGTEEQAALRQQVEFVELGQLKEYVAGTASQQIDLLFSLFESIDFSNHDKMIKHHLLTTGAITSVLSQIQIARCLLLSSIYAKSPGYLAEEE
jgi:hypothetical protein